MARAGRIALYSLYLAIVSLVGVIALWEAYDDSRLNLKRGAWHWTLAEKPTINYGMAYGARTREQTVRVLTANFSNPATAAQAFSQVERVKVPLQYDRCGMRSATPERGHSHDQAIALSGDSFMAGSENSYETTLQARLENALPFDIANFAISGSNSRYYADAAQDFQKCTGRQNFVAAVTSLYVDMNIGDIPRFVARDVFGHYTTLDGLATSDHRYQKARNSILYRLGFNAEFELRRWSSTYNRLFPPKARPEFALPLVDQLSDEKFQAWGDRIETHLERLAAELQVQPDQMVIWLVPSSHEINEELFARAQKRDVKAFVKQSEAGWNQIAERLKARGYRVVDTRPAIERFLFSTGVQPFSQSGHLRPEGYAIATDLILPELNAIVSREARKP